MQKIVNFFKIKKLKKLKRNQYYIRLKKEYQKLNDAGKKEFETFEKYKSKYQYFNYLNDKWFYFGRSKFDIAYSTTIMGFYNKLRWSGYHTQDYNCWTYIATQMECWEWAKKYNLKHGTKYYKSSDSSIGAGSIFVGAAVLASMFF